MATKPQIKRLKKLVDFLRNGVHRSKFDLGHWIGTVEDSWDELEPDPYKMEEDPTKKAICNTSACVIGWFPHLFPRMAQWKKSGRDEWIVTNTYGDSCDIVAEDLFCDITGIEAGHKIIYDGDKGKGTANYKSENPTPQSVAKRIIQVAKSEGIELD